MYYSFYSYVHYVASNGLLKSEIKIQKKGGITMGEVWTTDILAAIQEAQENDR